MTVAEARAKAEELRKQLDREVTITFSGTLDYEDGYIPILARALLLAQAEVYETCAGSDGDAHTRQDWRDRSAALRRAAEEIR